MLIVFFFCVNVVFVNLKNVFLLFIVINGLVFCISFIIIELILGGGINIDLGIVNILLVFV